jgi:hypothetical protein
MKRTRKQVEIDPAYERALAASQQAFDKYMAATAAGKDKDELNRLWREFEAVDEKRQAFLEDQLRGK